MYKQLAAQIPCKYSDLSINKKKKVAAKIATFPQTKKESPSFLLGDSLKKAATYSPALRCSTIGAPGLNFSVRDGKRWNTGAKAT